MKFKVEVYQNDKGDAPLDEFMTSIDVKMRAKALRSIELLEEFGNNLRSPYSAYLYDGIFELRIISGNNISRVLYFFVLDNRIIITHGFIKKTQKTPKGEIEKALKYKMDWQRRYLK